MLSLGVSGHVCFVIFVYQSIQQVAFTSGVLRSLVFRVSLVNFAVISAFQQLSSSLPVTAQSSSCSAVFYFSLQFVLQVRLL